MATKGGYAGIYLAALVMGTNTARQLFLMSRVA